jgi:phosphopantetheinyl transferase (holo-ACP synthase)
MPRVPFTYCYAPIDKLSPMLKTDAYWLTPYEQNEVLDFRDGTRRAAWLGGRLLAKRLIVKKLMCFLHSAKQPLYAVENGATPFQNVNYNNVEIRSAGSRPQVLVNGRALGWSLSISHTNRGALAAVSSRPDIMLGVDLVEPCAFGRGFAEVWFTPAERRWLESAGLHPRFVESLPMVARQNRPSTDVRHAIIWSIKEAAYKALNTGEQFYPRSIETIDLLQKIDRILELSLRQSPQSEIAVLLCVQKLPGGRRISPWRIGPSDCTIKIRTVPFYVPDGAKHD